MYIVIYCVFEKKNKIIQTKDHLNCIKGCKEKKIKLT